MNDWKSRINSYLEADRLANDIKKEEQMKVSLNQKLEKRQVMLNELGKKFMCCVCHKSATRPRQYNIGTSELLTSDPSFVFEDDWSEPGDLFQCCMCRKWTCNEHIHNRICKTCAEKLP